ncbi:hypothetical protein KFK09_021567 [Dendrobium nobile]|uniref:Exostosin GT47 domain-containing protein n=1 Tax=Dendrobium nobile TaxID=94219 RepID=A0A8T3ANY2_DENNO|nr:hypothetical protein KFK09_021567 [Dendrobium nobile]
MEKFSGKRRGRAAAAAFFIRHCPFFLYVLLIPLLFAVWSLLLHFTHLPSPPPPNDRCANRYIYIHNLPSRFNTDLLRNCRSLSQWTDMCLFLSNSGLGPPLPSSSIFPSSTWYSTNQFSLDLIFHHRINRYPCLTLNSSLASAIFVPFYAGLDISRHLWSGPEAGNVSVRDSSLHDLTRWLTSRPEWAVMGGRDHFFVAGRITWDFRRLSDGETDWGSKLLLLPALANMTALVIESSPWHTNDMAIPYPTYFHPSTDADVTTWQDRVLWLRRPFLFSFAGAPRPNRTDEIRGRLTDQCRGSERCGLLECGSSVSRCHSPESVMKLFESSVFCLQPQGDSYTRRSAFDAMVAGCIPVFFHPGSAYVQYFWHLPKNYSSYSVFIPEKEVREGKVKVEDILSKFGEEKVRAMREQVVRLIPRLVYGDPRGKMESVKDAFDVAVEGVIERVEGRRRRMDDQMRIWSVDVDEEEESWQFYLGGRGRHEWDYFFSSTSM